MRRSNSWPISIHGSASSSTANRTPSPKRPPRHLSPLSRKRANMNTEAKVGAFVIVSLLTLGVATYFVRTTQSVRAQVPYKTYLRYAGGLAPGAAVLFGGIKVGQVTAVRPWSEDPTRIEIRFAVTSG